MPLITLFSAPKPFTHPHIATIQRNAIKSWTLLPEVEVILLGEEEGLAEAARELGVKHIPHVERNAGGVPLLSSMFHLARENSHSDLLCIINADIILMPDFLRAALDSRSLLLENRRQAARLQNFILKAALESRSLLLKDQRQAARLQNFILLSQRWDLDVTQSIEFTEGWQDRLSALVRSQGTLHRPAGSDFFLFPRSAYHDVPPFTIGRAGWDNWMIYKARREGWPVIDCTPSVMIVHQNHDYSHLPGGKPHYDHPETNENIRLAGGQANIRYTILDATHQLVDGTLASPKMSAARLARRLELLLRSLFFFLPENTLENLVRPRRWKKRIQKLLKRR